MKVWIVSRKVNRCTWVVLGVYNSESKAYCEKHKLYSAYPQKLTRDFKMEGYDVE